MDGGIVLTRKHCTMNESTKNIIHNTIISTTIRIQPALHPTEPLRLSPNDWIMPADRYPVCCIFFYDIHQWPLFGGKANDEFMNVDRLISSLTKLIEYYPLLAGVLKVDEKDKTTSIVFDNDQGGILFNSVSVNIPLCHLPLSSNEYMKTMALYESLKLTNKTDVCALFHVRHTRFLCGGVALTIHLNHCIGDAYSYFQLVRDWVQMYHDIEYRPIVCHKRSLLERTWNDIEAHKHLWPNFNKQNTLMVKPDVFPQVEQQTAPSIIKIFRFSADELERMKKDATTHLPSEVNYVSTFDVLTAHLYRHVAIARNSSHSFITKLYMSTDFRSRLKQPSLPSTYFGNAILYSYFETESQDLIRIDDIGFWAGQVHQAIAAKTSDEIESTLAWIISQPDKSKIMPTCNPVKTDFLITGCHKINMYSHADFEVGVYPSRITAPLGETFNGAAILCSTEKNDGSIDVILGLNMDTMGKLENNIHFRKYR